jgi:SAM-dependent methyltransferase
MSVSLKPNITRVIYNKNEILDHISSYTHDQRDQIQYSDTVEYTLGLVESRLMVLEDLSNALREHLGQFLRKDHILEIGPGVEDILYDILLPSFDKPKPCWTALDINPSVVESLSKKYASFKNYTALTGTARKMNFEDKSFDVVIGMDSLDSIADFDGVAREIHRVLRPQGYMVHIQDMPPSLDVLLHLSATDPNLPHTYEIEVYNTTLGNGNGGITHIEFPGKNPVQTHEYLHRGLEKKFEEKGFTTHSTGLRKYSNKFSELYATVNIILNRSLALPAKYNETPHYSFIVMQKN